MVTKKSGKPTVRRVPAKRTTEKKPRASTSIWDDLAAIGRTIPDVDLDKLPRDLVKNFDHYAHGSPREE